MSKFLALLLLILPCFAQDGFVRVIRRGTGACTLSYTTTLVGHYEQDSGLTCTGGCSNGNAVTAWTDQSSNGSNLSASGGTITYATNVNNSLPGVTFSSGWMTFSKNFDPSQSGSGAISIFMVAKTTGGTGTTGVTSGSSNGYAQYLNYSPHFQSAVKQGVAGTDSTSGQDTTNWNQLNTIYLDYNGSTGTYAFRKNRADDGSGTHTMQMSNGSQINRFGNDSNTYKYSGTVQAILIYSSALSTTNRNTVEDYLYCKYGK